MRGKIIVIEGTDCSGKETQSKRLIERLINDGIKIEYFSYPNYENPTGKIIGGPLLGKPHICESWFDTGAANVDPYVMSLFYAADRKYNSLDIEERLNKGINVVIDRYTYSNMAHQASKIIDKEKRLGMYKWIEKLEFEMLELPIPDIKLFLHVPFEISDRLKRKREEILDSVERDEKYCRNGEIGYSEIVKIYDFKVVECTKDGNILPIDEINDIVYEYVKDKLSS